MKHTLERHPDVADRTVIDIRRKTRKRYSSEDEIRIVLAGLRDEDTVPNYCRNLTPFSDATKFERARSGN